MYKLKLVYDPEPRTQTLKESITYCAVVHLLVQHGIDCCQTSAAELAFETEGERFIAVISLSSSTSFTPVYVDD